MEGELWCCCIEVVSFFRAMLGDEDDSDSEENLLARMEAMGCDMDLEE